MILVRTRIVAPAELKRAAACYAAWGYGGGIGAQDAVLLAESDGEWLGLVRLAPEGGVLVLRGMQVRPDARRHGVGTQLLGTAVTWLDGPGRPAAPCYGVPYVHLLGFYARGGFVECALADAPGFLTARVAEYRGRGLRVTLMCRAPRGDDRGCWLTWRCT